MAETIFIKYYEETDCLHGYSVERTVELKRQEAIERMVLAMHNEEIKRSIKDIPCDYRNLAEAALNALLEADNGL